MTTERLIKRLIRWPIPAEDPPITLKLVDLRSYREWLPSRRRTWLLYRVAAALLSGREVPAEADDFELGEACRRRCRTHRGR